MSELFLIAHKVSGEPAFDVATQMPCPHCQDYESATGVWCEAERHQDECSQCDGLGYWWMISTSGHRAYPWWNLPLKYDETGLVMDHNPTMLHWTIPAMPSGIPDHYAHKSAPAIDLATTLGLHKAKPLTPTKPFPRRI